MVIVAMVTDRAILGRNIQLTTISSLLYVHYIYYVMGRGNNGTWQANLYHLRFFCESEISKLHKVHSKSNSAVPKVGNYNDASYLCNKLSSLLSNRFKKIHEVCIL